MRSWYSCRDEDHSTGSLSCRKRTLANGNSSQFPDCNTRTSKLPSIGWTYFVSQPRSFCILAMPPLRFCLIAFRIRESSAIGMVSDQEEKHSYADNITVHFRRLQICVAWRACKCPCKKNLACCLWAQDLGKKPQMPVLRSAPCRG